MVEDAIFIMAKAPIPGRVKTRLCPPLTPTQAADLYVAFLHDTFIQAQQVAADLYLICPTEADARVLSSLINGVNTVTQEQPGLTSGLIKAFQHGTQMGYSKIMALSSDNPTLPSGYLKNGFAALESHVASLGPSSDGGYYFIAATHLYKTLFTNMKWSTNRVLEETLKRARQANLSVFLAPEWYDIDTASDLLRLITEFSDIPHTNIGEHTYRILHTPFSTTADSISLATVVRIYEARSETIPEQRQP